METYTLQKQSTTSFSTYLAIVSFSFGTLLLLFHLVCPRVLLILIIGLYYVVFAVLINFLALLVLCYQFLAKPQERETVAIRILILLSNIPIALLYFFIVIR